MSNQQDIRRGSQQSWTGSDIFNSPLSVPDHPLQNVSNSKLSGKAWGRVKKFLVCKTRFPSCIYYIVGNEFCERFSYYGMKAILILYLTRVLPFEKNTATAVFHSFSMLCYFTPLFGAMLADGWLGKYRTILYISIVYSIGNLIVSITSLRPLGAGEIPGPVIGLLLIAIGTGGIKPCVSAFGGDQFTSDQSHLLQNFFSVFYFAINAGSLLSMLITPVLRGDVKCFGDDCYPLAFGVPAALMLLAVALFWFGRHKYKRVPPTGNIVWQVVKAVSYALKKKCTVKEGKRDHWMDWADDKYDVQLIQDIKSLCKVLFMFLPLPVFWTLFDQQGSRWVLQAGEMDGDAGFLGTIKPDQMQALNALFILLLIPLFEGVVYPILQRPTPLKRMSAGMVLAALAFVIAGFVQIKIQKAEVIKGTPPNGQANLQVINSLACPVKVSIENKTFSVSSRQHSLEKRLSVAENISIIITPNNCHNLSKRSFAITLEENQWYNFVISYYRGAIVGRVIKENITLPPPGKAKLCALVMPLAVDENFFEIFLEKNKVLSNVSGTEASSCAVASANRYKLAVKGSRSGKLYVASDVSLKNGGVYTAVVHCSMERNGTVEVGVYEDLEAKSISMFWQIPQYFVITSGEILFSITGLEFAYSQAPRSMKSCLQAAWLLTVAIGNLIVVIEAESHLFSNPAVEFFFFAAMLFVVMLVFVAMSMFYRYVESSVEEPAVPIPVDLSDDKVGILGMDELGQI